MKSKAAVQIVLADEFTGGFLGNGGCFADAQPTDSRKRFHRQPVSGGYLRYCSHAALQHHR